MTIEAKKTIPSTTLDIALIALFAAIMALLGLVPKFDLPFLPVPITGQSLGPMLAGLILGARRGFLSMLLFVALVAAGLPLLAGFRGGLGVFAGPTAGFVIGFPIAAWVVGAVQQRLPSPFSFRSAWVACLLGGIVALYALGVPWLALVAGMPLTKAAGLTLVFVPGDVLKAALAAYVAAGVNKSGVLARLR